METTIGLTLLSLFGLITKNRRVAILPHTNQELSAAVHYWPNFLL